MKGQSSAAIPAGAPEGAPELHFDSYVFDYSPIAEPIILTSGTETVMNDALDAGADGGTALRAMVETRNQELETDPAVREKVQGVWQASGVNGVQVTLGATALGHAWEGMIRDVAHYQRRARAGGDMTICTTPDELEAAAADGKVGILLGAQDCPIGTDMAKLDLLHDFGVRVMQLTFNTRNTIGDGCTERGDAGLSRFGLEVVARFNELGIIVDVSHSNNRTKLDAIETSERPMAITHSTCHEVAPHPRASTDEQLKLLAEHDGHFGVNVVPFFVVPGGGSAATLDMVADHIEHAAGILGVERVGIATDWGLWPPDFPDRLKAAGHRKLVVKTGRFSAKDVPKFDDKTYVEGFEKWEYWSNITAKLLERFSEQEVRGLVGGNWLGFMRRFEEGS